ncbi:MAG TPA: penicillinase repressor [Chitinophagaceae bacterium]|jgi:predicted transcriptional regulator|nr:penicillinase repressor [Chitinophagaceae bacterium]HAN39879.1 penicillinase repressor [Chitinophagaceae bacterium]
MELTKAEAQIMDIVWQNEPLYFKSILEHLPEPKPASSTVATLLKRIQEKQFIAFRLHGNSRQYYSLVPKTAYFKNQLGNLVRNFFDNSPVAFASFFTEQSTLSKKELEALKAIIDAQIKAKDQ